jgi:16S rRNA (cytosine967-C5)-methyltransferase
VALVGRLGEALATFGASDVDPRVRERARAGRVRDVATSILTEQLAHPASADGVARRRLRDAKFLHSNERRFVGDGVADVLRFRLALALAADVDAGDGPALWDAWLAADPTSFADAVTRRLADADPARQVAVVAGVPDDVGGLLLAALGDDVGPFLAASNRRAAIALRANRARGDRDAVARRLAAEGVETRPSELAPDALLVVGRANLEALPSFREGWFEIQDEASQCVAALADVGRGAVLDWCAGAGGKALALASSGRPVVATDVRASALRELQVRADRAGARIRTELLVDGDLAAPISGVASVLVDAPCTGTGVWRRHPAFRLGLSARPPDRLAQEQAHILARAARHVPSGGRLVYATCSVLAVENDDVIGAFLAGHPEFEPEGAPRRWTPHGHATDGFTATPLRRR